MLMFLKVDEACTAMLGILYFVRSLLNLVYIIVPIGLIVMVMLDFSKGVISINDRIECDDCNDINGDLNMLYVSEYEATIPTFLLSYIIPNWDVEKVSEQQVNNESTEDIYTRNRLMLESSISNAIYVAYTKANKKIENLD